MNWYKIFYFLTISDNIKSFFNVMSDIFTFFAVICLIFFVLITIISADVQSNGDAEKDAKDLASLRFWQKTFQKFLIWSSVFMFITWTAYIFTPSKKDCLLIVAGGAVGNFITSDSSAKNIPSELTLLIREKLKEEIKEVKNDATVKSDTAKVETKAKEISVKDTLINKSKEELIKMINSK